MGDRSKASKCRNREDDDSIFEKFRSILQDELAKTNNSIADLRSEVNCALKLADEAKSIAQDAKVSASNAVTMATEAKESVARMSTDTMTDLDMIKTHQAQMYQQMLTLESYSRRNNLLFEGIPESRGEYMTDVILSILASMDINITKDDILGCHRIGIFKKDHKEPRSSIVKFLRFSDRSEIWSARRKLSGNKIWLKEDFPKEIEKRRDILKPYLSAAYQGDPKNPKGRISAFLNLDKLHVNNQTFTFDSIHSLPHYIRDRVETIPQLPEGDAFLFAISRDEHHADGGSSSNEESCSKSPCIQ